jgi:hypothetical protein
MAPLEFKTHIGTPVTVDVCWPCHLIWFDQLESSSLALGAVIDLFRRIHEARTAGDQARNLVSRQLACPICDSRLVNTSDIARGGRFSYFRCPHGHGRAIAFTQFLREKNFIRTLQPAEIAALSVTVKQVRCSSCGGPVDLVNDTACTHCGSPISVLDDAAVERALMALQEKEFQRVTPDPARINAALLEGEVEARRARRAAGLRADMETWSGTATGTSALADLVELGISATLSAWLD